MNAPQIQTHYTRAITEQVLCAPRTEKTWADYLQDGREWARRSFHPLSSHILNIEATAFAYADMNAPRGLKLAHFAAAKALRDAEFGL